MKLCHNVDFKRCIKEQSNDRREIIFKLRLTSIAKQHKTYCINLVSSVWGYNLELSKWIGTYEPTRPTTGLDQVGLKFFYKFEYGLIFDPAYLEQHINNLVFFYFSLYIWMY